MRTIEELRKPPGNWEEDEKTFWVDLRDAFYSGDYKRSKEIILDSIRLSLPRYKAVSIVVPVWKEISEKNEELQHEIEQSLLLGPSSGLLQVYVETWPDKIDGKVLTEGNIREFLNYDGSEKIGLLQSLLPPRFRPQYLTAVRDLFFKDQLGYQDVVVEYLMDQQVLTGDEALIALSKQAMNWPTQHLYVKLVRNSSLDKDALRKITEGVLLRELTTITEPLLRDLDYPEETISQIVRDSFILHASYFELEEVFSIAQSRCKPDDMEKVVNSANYKKLRQKLDRGAAIVENVAETERPPLPSTSNPPQSVTDDVKDFFLSHASEDKEFVLPLATELKSRGMSVWVDVAEVTLGDNLFERINDAIKRTRYVIAFLSKNFINKKWPNRELYAAMAIEDQSGTKKVLPIMLTSPEEILPAYPLLAEKVYLTYDMGLSVIAERCREMIDGTRKVVDITQYPLEDREEIARAKYSKKEGVEKRYITTVSGHHVAIQTGLPNGTKVLAEVSQLEIEQMAVDIGARKTVVDALNEVMPGDKGRISSDERAMKALMEFAQAVGGGRSALKEYRQRIPAVVGVDGVLELDAVDIAIPGGKVEIALTILGEET